MQANNLNSIIDDYSLEEVPAHGKQSFYSLFIVRFGCLASITQFLLGATIGNGLPFWHAVIALVLASILLQTIAVIIGIIGYKEGLGLSLLSVRYGFGKIGAALVGFVIALSLVGWFGVQNAMFAQGFDEISQHILGFQLSTILTGLFTLLIVFFGFKFLSFTAKIIVPLFIIFMGYVVIVALKDFSVTNLFTNDVIKQPLSFNNAISIVSGGYIVGAIINPDITRFAKNQADAIWSTVLSILTGEIFFGLLGILLVKSTHNPDIINLVYTVAGVFGSLIIILSVIKNNDITLYSATLGIATAIKSITGKSVNRGLLTLYLGIIGTLLSTFGIIDALVGFLITLGLVIPPIASIIIIDYFFFTTDKNYANSNQVTVIALLAWLIGAVASYYITSIVQTIVSMAISGAFYYLANQLRYKLVVSKSNCRNTV